CFDAPIHMSEEARNAVIVIPWTIILSTASTLILGWASGYSVRGSLAVWSAIVVVQFTIGVDQ
ncbi:hypothetical protein MPER_13860, partial [Moniliophthora perniciosa FA553]